ncbi:restriction endonuclease subunit S [Desulfovibrio falkowii]|uniref:Type I restriction modification DNA specificity domain-containing protein n=1 Tax=Desulfovibrio falkowii TaxID=3136602 RepID=A0ABQ0EAX9_9BACT
MKKHSEFQLGDIATFIRGINFKPDDVVKLDVPNAVACMRTKNVQSVLDLSDVWAVDRKFVKRDEQFLRDGDILVSSANSWNLVGKCCYIDNIPYVSSFGGFVSVIRPTSEKIIPRFLYHWFASDIIQTKVRSFGRQTTNISNLDLTRCLELPLSLPSHDEQRRIAAILDKADAIRRKRQQSLKLTGDLVKSQFIEMFGGGEHFPQKQLHEVALISGGLTKNASKRVNYELKIPYLRVANVFFNRLDLTEVLTLSVHPNELGKGLLQAGDLLFVEGNGSIEQVGRVAIWDGSIQPCVHQNHLIKVRFNPGVMNPRFAMFFFMGDAGRAQIMGKAVSTSGLHTLSVNKIETLSIPLPPIELQNQFAAFVEQADKSKFAMQNQLSEIEKLSSALKQTFFA